jgi:hypothetical protein
MIKHSRIVAAGVVAILSIGVVVRRGNNAPPRSMATEILSGPAAGTPEVQPVHTGRHAAEGWSTADDPRTAVQEAVAMMRARLGGKSPSFVLASFTALYNCGATINALRAELGPDVKIHGITSVAGLMTNEGLHVGKVVGVLGVADEGIQFGVGGVDPDQWPSLKDAGKAAILRAIADAGRLPNEKPNLILCAASMRRGGEMKLLEGIASVVGPDVPVMGGNAGDEKADHHWAQFSQNCTYRDGLVLTAVYSKRKLGWAFESGFRITDKTGIVTKSDGKTLYEINHRPALDVYNEWLNGRLLDYMRTHGPAEISIFTVQYPLGKVLRGANGQVGYLISHPAPTQADIGPKTVPVYALIEQGSNIELVSESWQTNLNRAELAPSDALVRGDIPRDDAMFGMLFFCSGAYSFIPAAERSKLPLLVTNAIGDTPFLGMMTIGEQGYIPGVGNVSANLVVSMVAVGNK